MTLLLVPILLPILGGLATGLIRFSSRRTRSIFVEIVALANSALLFYLVFRGQGLSLSALRLTENLTITLRVDGLTRVFGALIAFLWPLATLYAFEYMEAEGRENTFFAYYLMSYGVTAGIALSGNLFTLYAFYELLTLVTLPLVLHKLDTTYMTDGALRVDADPADVDFDALTIAVFDSHNELLGEVYD